MAIIRCKMCGGELNIADGTQTVAECEYCGSKQTIPTADDEKKMNMFARAGRLMRSCEFDKAAGIYESIITDFPTEAEAYWGLVISKYGIEYVDDPATGKKVPTCHRSSFDSVMDDTNFEQACENADTLARRVYREEAKQIEELRKGIIEVSANEQPYDIFISYKEKDDFGERTIDSVLAQDIYDALTDKGYRVFFSRISLEDKLGIEYEPYIFAALNSAKIMLVVGTDYEYFNAVWVKNEWSRFLKLMASDKSKHLIPCFKGIDAYDMPKEFNKLTAQDLGKVGAVQDLVRGIDKLVSKTENQPAQTASPQIIQQVVSGGSNVDALLRRGYDSLEDGAFEEAETLFNDALNSNAQSAEAYLGLFMALTEAANHSEAQSEYVSGNYTDNRYWKRAKQYASSTLLATLNEWDSMRNARLQREAEAARKAKEEADRKAKEEAKRKAEASKKKQTEINALREQLRTGNEIVRLEGLISSKKNQLAGLGLFKVKEKKELQTQIDTLTCTLEKIRKTVEEKIFSIVGITFNGDKVLFGSYKHGSGIKPIEWRVLDKSDKGILLITEYAIKRGEYHKTLPSITWEKCDLRKWLNNDFLNTAFDEFERTLIADTRCPADKNPKYNTAPGNATTDKVFLLSISEAEKYFKSDEDRKCVPTEHTVKYCADTSTCRKGGAAACWWWLRSPGYSSYYAAGIYSDGLVDFYGHGVSIGDDCVRPALWINLES